MTNKKPKTNKWTEEKLLELSYKHDNEITMAIDDIAKLITQTQQETLEWVLNQIVWETITMTSCGGKPEHKTDYIDPHKLSQTIKQRMEEGK